MGSPKLGRGLLFGDFRGREGGRHHYKLLFSNCLVFEILGFFIPRLCLGMNSKNLILLFLFVFLVFELPGAAGDKYRALEFQKPQKGKT